MHNSFPHINPHACYRDVILDMILPKEPQLDPTCIFYQDPLMAVLDINTQYEQYFDRLSKERTQYLNAHMDSFSEDYRNKLTEINDKMNETVMKFKTSAYLNDHEFKKLRKNKDHLIRSYVPGTSPYILRKFKIYLRKKLAKEFPNRDIILFPLTNKRIVSIFKNITEYNQIPTEESRQYKVKGKKGRELILCLSREDILDFKKTLDEEAK